MQKSINWLLLTKALIFIFTLSFGTGLHAQFQYDNQWIFAKQNDTTSILDFTGDSLEVREAIQDLELGATNFTISNFDGRLLFYSNGCEIRDSSFQLMVGGDGLNSGEIATQYCENDYPSIHQSMLTLPSLDNDSIYHVFHKRVLLDFNMTPVVVTDSLFHTIVNINGNNGLGVVIQKNKGINSKILGSGRLNAVKKFDSNSWWIFSIVRDSDEIEIYELKNEIIASNSIQSLGDYISEDKDNLQVLFSPLGDLFLRAYSDIGIFLNDFDRETGIFSNPRHIPFTIEPKFGGAAISPNGRFLYVNSLIEIWQFDLESNDIETSKTLIDTYDGYQSPFASTFFKAQLGPDCKLYYNSNNGEDVLHVMHNPNVKGTACNFEQHGVQLFTSHGISLPYFPSYRLDTDYPICDTTKLVATSINIPIRPASQIWAASPNPTSGIFYLATNKMINREVHIFIYDAGGRLIVSDQLQQGRKSIEINLSGKNSGIYFYQVIGEEGNVANGRVVKY